MDGSRDARPIGASHDAAGQTRSTTPAHLKFLNARWIQMVNECLASVGAYGEVRLSMGDGRLVGLKATRSYDALKGLTPD